MLRGSLFGKSSLKVILAAFLLTASVLGGCQSKTVAPEPQPNLNGSAKGTLLSEKPVTFQWMISEHPNYPLQNDNPIFKTFEEKTNVKIEFLAVPAAGYTEKYNIMLSSNSVPDLSWAKDQATVYGPKGMFLKLNDLIDKHGVNMKKYVLDPAVKPNVAAADGGVYSILCFNTDNMDRVQYGWHYREDILNKLGLKEPTTYGEWYEVLKKVKSAYPDMIPFTMRKEDWKWNAANASYHTGNTIILNPFTDKFEYAPITARSKEAVEWYTKLYKEGLLDKEFFTNAKKDFDQKVNTGRVFGFAAEWFNVGTGAMRNARKEGLNDIVFNVAPPPKTSYGPAVIAAGDYVDRTNCVALSSKIKNPEVAVKFIDYIGFTAEGLAILNFGVEGQHWKMESYGPDYTDDELKLVTEGKSGSWQLGFNDRIPRLSRTNFYKEAGKKGTQSEDPIDKKAVANQQKLLKYLPEKPTPVLDAFFDDKARADIKEINSVVDTLWNEYRVKFIVGTEPLTNWDKLVSQMKKNRVEELEKIYNDAYTKYKAIK